MKIEKSNMPIVIRILTSIMIMLVLGFAPVEIFYSEKNIIEIVEKMNGDVPSKLAFEKLLLKNYL